MKQSFKYTVFALALALVFVCCSMAGMNMILAARERALLSEKGNAIVQSPIRAWETERKTSHLIEIEGEGLKEAEQEERRSEPQERRGRRIYECMDGSREGVRPGKGRSKPYIHEGRV